MSVEVVLVFEVFDVACRCPAHRPQVRVVVNQVFGQGLVDAVHARQFYEEVVFGQFVGLPCYPDRKY